MVHYRTDLNLPAPDDHDPFALLPQTVRDLADALGIVIGGTSVEATTLVLASGWSVSEGKWRISGTWLSLRLVVTRTGADISCDAAGDCPNTDICTIPPEFLPEDDHRLTIYRESAATWAGKLFAATGDIALTSGPPSKTLTTGSVLQINQVVSMT